MSIGFALLLLVSVSAATSSLLSPDLVRIPKRSLLAMTMARSRHKTILAPMVNALNSIQQKWGKPAKPKEKQEFNNSVSKKPVPELPNYWFKVCTKCSKLSGFLDNLAEKEAAEAARRAVIQQIRCFQYFC